MSAYFEQEMVKAYGPSAEQLAAVTKINKIAVLIGERSREECGEDEFFRRLCDIVGVVLA